MKKKLILLSALLVVLLSQAQEPPKKILFIGNSYTYVNDLPSMVQQMAESAGHRIEFQQVTSGGATFNQQCSSTGAMDRIREGGWDIVVLQAQSQEPSFPWSQFTAETYPYACQLADAVYQYNECPEVMFYMTWGRKNGDSQNAPYFDSLATYEGMDNLLYERYMYMAHQNQASVSPVGRVWRKIRSEHPEIELYQSDESHPSVIGSYAAACTFYTLIFRDDPTLIATDLSIDATTAQIIRESARTVVYDSLQLYSCHTFMAAEPAEDSLRWQFQCLSSTLPETVVWDFGDGETTTEANPSHTFEAGTYTVTLIAGKSCDPDTNTIVITINDPENPENPEDPENPSNGISQLSDFGFSVFPNPASSHFNVKTDHPVVLKLIDTKGCIVLQSLVSDNETVNIEKLPSGIYIISIDNQTAGKLVKKQH